MFGGDLELLLNPNHELVALARRLDWAALERKFAPLYPHGGRPSIPVRVMVSLLLIQRLKNVSDEEAVKQWVQNPYWQYLSGMVSFQWEVPCDLSELSRFRMRLGITGAAFILAWTVGAHKRARTVQTDVVVVDTTVQEKSVTTPRDHKLYRKVIERLRDLAERHELRLRRSYRRRVAKLVAGLRTSNYPRAKMKAKQITARLRTIARRLLRELEHKLPAQHQLANADFIAVCRRVIEQQHNDGKPRIYAVHEPQIYAIGKGKDRAAWEFGTKVSIAVGLCRGIVLGAITHHRNTHDSHTVTEIIANVEIITGCTPHTVLGDLGYRDHDEQNTLRLHHINRINPHDHKKADRINPAGPSLRRLMRLRSRSEAVIGDLERSCRLTRHYLAGWIGDEINVIFAAAGSNLKKLLRLFRHHLQATFFIAQLITAYALLFNAPTQTQGFRINRSPLTA